MAIAIELPDEIELQLRNDVADLDASAKEAALIEWYRERLITHHQLAVAMGVSRYEVDGLLKRHGVCEDLITPAEFESQRSALQQLLGE
jgi:hypothetical protein